MRGTGLEYDSPVLLFSIYGIQRLYPVSLRAEMVVDGGLNN